MSAFMVNDKTINRVVSFISRKLLEESPHLKDKFLEIGFDIEAVDFCDKLGQAMFELNIKGVDSRYGEGEAKSFRPLDYKFTPEYNIPAVHAFKDLNCWNYQCSEGDVVNDPFYKFMEFIEGQIACYIVHKLPEYEALPWS